MIGSFSISSVNLDRPETLYIAMVSRWVCIKEALKKKHVSQGETKTIMTGASLQYTILTLI